MAHDCGKHDGCKLKKCHWYILGVVVIVLIILIVLIIFVPRAIIRPSEPHFIIQDATLYNFNVSTNPDLLTSTIQLTITSRNPNKHGIYYDHLGVFGTYRDQQITLPFRIPSVYQGHNEVNVWSPLISGNRVPIAPYNAVALAQDQNLQVVDLVIKLTGQVKYKANSFPSKRYQLDVRCPARITFGSHSTGVLVGNAVKYQLALRCSVSI